MSIQPAMAREDIYNSNDNEERSVLALQAPCV